MDVIPLAFGLLGFAAGCLGLRETIQRAIDLVQHVPRSIASLKPGQRVKVCGQIVQNNDPQNPLPIQSRLSQVPCAFWQVQVFSASGGASGSHASRIYEISSQQPILLADATGLVTVELAKAQVELLDYVCFTDHNFSPVPFRQGHFRELKTEAFVAGPYRLRHSRRNLKVVERVLVPGDAIVVWGTVRDQEGGRRIWARRISDSQTYQLYGLVLVAIASFIVTYICLGIVLSSLGPLLFK